LVYGDAEMLTVGFVEFAKQPFAFVTLTEFAPVAVTVMACVVAPLLHNHELPADAVSTTLFPSQKVVGPPAVMLAAGNEFTVTTVGAEVRLHPPVVTTTV
jgi:hypothetical protein